MMLCGWGGGGGGGRRNHGMPAAESERRPMTSVGVCRRERESALQLQLSEAREETRGRAELTTSTGGKRVLLIRFEPRALLVNSSAFGGGPLQHSFPRFTRADPARERARDGATALLMVQCSIAGRLQALLLLLIGKPCWCGQFSSADYWEDRYHTKGNSGAGSYGVLAAYKAGFLNAFVAAHTLL